MNLFKHSFQRKFKKFHKFNEIVKVKIVLEVGFSSFKFEKKY